MHEVTKVNEFTRTRESNIYDIMQEDTSERIHKIPFVVLVGMRRM